VGFIGGGGNMTGTYDHVENAFNKFIDADACQIVMLPHGIRESEDTLLRTRPHDIIVCRDWSVFGHVRGVTMSPSVLLAHDMAFHLDVRRFFHDRRLTTQAEPMLRDRPEEHGWSPEAIAASPRMTFTRTDTERLHTSPQADLDLSVILMFGDAERESAIAAWCLLECIRRSQRIVTDRLHVAISSALLGVPCEFLPNSYGKNSSVYDFSPWMFPNINFRSPLGRVE